MYMYVLQISFYTVYHVHYDINRTLAFLSSGYHDVLYHGIIETKEVFG